MSKLNEGILKNLLDEQTINTKEINKILQMKKAEYNYYSDLWYESLLIESFIEKDLNNINGGK